MKARTILTTRFTGYGGAVLTLALMIGGFSWGALDPAQGALTDALLHHPPLPLLLAAGCIGLGLVGCFISIRIGGFDSEIPLLEKLLVGGYLLLVFGWVWLTVNFALYGAWSFACFLASGDAIFATFQLLEWVERGQRQRQRSKETLLPSAEERENAHDAER